MSDYEEYRGYRIKIIQDEFDTDPRKEFDQLGTMICFHRNYDLGDKKTEWWQKDADSFMEEFSRMVKEREIAVWRWLYLFDHSGLRMSSDPGDFRAVDPQGWDWGKVGIIYLTREKMQQEYGWKVLTSGRKQKLLNYLDNEVQTYDQYLSGDVWGYMIEAPLDEHPDDPDEADQLLLDDDNWQEIPWGSCWGFYGYKYCLQEAKSEVDSHIDRLKREAKERQERIETSHQLLFVENMAVGL